MKKLLFLMLVAVSLQAENLDDILNNAKKYIAEKKYSKALSELSWAEKELNKLKLDTIRQTLPAELAGYKGSEFREDDSSAMMGLAIVKREYVNADKSFNLELTLKSSENSLMGGLFDLGKMAAAQAGSMGGAGVFRVKGRTAAFDKENATNPDLTIFLDSGAMLKLSDNKGADLKALAESLDLDKIETAIKEG